MTFGEPVMVLPMPPQSLTMSLRRCAALPLMKTVPLPTLAFHLFGPQQRRMNTRVADLYRRQAVRKDVGEPAIAGPTTGCGHAGQPCASAGHNDRSETRACGGIVSSTG